MNGAEEFARWVVLWASMLEVQGPIPITVVDLKGQSWARTLVDQYAMPYMLVDYRLTRSRARVTALHEVCHIKLNHTTFPDLPEKQKEDEVRECIRTYSRAR